MIGEELFYHAIYVLMKTKRIQNDGFIREFNIQKYKIKKKPTRQKFLKQG